jgi:ABC-type multidrug transport system permease subunit
MFMALLFSSQGMAQDFWKDKSQGIINRLLSSPVGLNQYMNGKLLSALIVFGLIALLIGGLGLFIFAISMTKIMVILAWLMLSGLLLWSMMLLLTLLLPSEKSANLVTQGMVFPLMMLGGSFFPFDAMPKWMVMIGEKLPNGFMLQGFNRWFIEDNGLSALTFPALLAVLIIVLLWVLNQGLLLKFARKK